MNFEAQRVFLSTPWGQVVTVDFSPEELSMIDDITKLTQDSWETVIISVAKERFEKFLGF